MKILFVCTANVFRSMSAECLTKKYLDDNNIRGIQVSSAGTEAEPEMPYSYTIDRLRFYGCEADQHRQTKITREVLEDKDIIICMSKHHQDFVKAMGYSAILFNAISYGKEEDLLDEREYEQIHGKIDDLKKYIYEIVDYIHDAVPFLVKNLDIGHPIPI